MAEDNTGKYTGPKRYVEYEVAEGRTVQYVRYWHSPRDGQAVVIQFSDGLRIRIGVEPMLCVETEVAVLRDGDLQNVERFLPIYGPLVL